MDYKVTIFELILLVIVSLSMFIGYKKGFVKSFSDLVSNIVAVVTARFVSSTYTQQIYSAYIESPIKERIGEIIKEAGKGTSNKVQAVIDGVPGMNGFMSIVGVDSGSVASSVKEQVNSGSVSITDAVMGNLVSPVVTFILRIVLFVIAFILCLIIMKILTKILDKLSKLPLLKNANALFGIIFGCVKGIIICILICAVCRIITGFIDSPQFNQMLSDSAVMTVFDRFFGSLTA